jgi:hypothetical protein
MLELGAILRTSNEPAKWAASLGLLGPLAGRFASDRQPFYPTNIHTDVFQKPQAIHLVSQICHADVIFCRWFAGTTLPPRYGCLCDPQAFSELGL